MKSVRLVAVLFIGLFLFSAANAEANGRPVRRGIAATAKAVGKVARFPVRAAERVATAPLRLVKARRQVRANLATNGRLIFNGRRFPLLRRR